MSNIITKTCPKCQAKVYEIEGKYATKKDGTVLTFLQKWDDPQGTNKHFFTCAGVERNNNNSSGGFTGTGARQQPNNNNNEIIQAIKSLSLQQGIIIDDMKTIKDDIATIMTTLTTPQIASANYTPSSSSSDNKLPTGVTEYDPAESGLEE